jgi:CheY-like chemotaxis protein
MNASAYNQIWNSRHQSNRLNFALVIEKAGNLRNSIIALLRGRGWLVHGISRAEQALNILHHIPYSLIVLDSELPGICPPDFVRTLRTSRESQTIRLVVINGSESPVLESQIKDYDAFLVRRSMWEDDLFGFLVAYERDTPPSANCGHA